MIVQLDNCPFCKSETIANHLQVKDFSISKEEFKLSKCSECGLIFTNPRPDNQSIGKYYDSPDYISHSDSDSGIVNKIYKRVRGISIKDKFKEVNRFAGKNYPFKLLDIGCGTGSFLAYCKENGVLCTGIEPNEGARTIAKEKHGLSAYNSDHLFQVEGDSLDVITMWHVLEHVDNLNEYISKLHYILKPGGYCFIAVPNPTSYDAIKYGAFWAAYDVPRHLSHFAPATIKKMFQTFDFKIVKSIPMKWDAYYISLLSEKYKRDNASAVATFLSAIVNGFLSNIKAGSADKYSSVIYVFQK